MLNFGASVDFELKKGRPIGLPFIHEPQLQLFASRKGVFLFFLLHCATDAGFETVFGNCGARLQKTPFSSSVPVLHCSWFHLSI